MQLGVRMDIPTRFDQAFVVEQGKLESFEAFAGEREMFSSTAVGDRR